MKFPGILFISSNGDKKTLKEELIPLLDAGLKWYQLRLKDKSDNDILDCVNELYTLCRRYNCLFTLNDYTTLAIKMNIDGVHIGKSDENPLTVKKQLDGKQHFGITCNSYNDIVRAKKYNASYVGLGPYQFTFTKKNLSPILGLDGYKEILENLQTEKLQIPIVAIGGLNLEAVEKLHEIGINHFAFSSYFIGSKGTENFKKIQDYVGK